MHQTNHTLVYAVHHTKFQGTHTFHNGSHAQLRIFLFLFAKDLYSIDFNFQVTPFVYKVSTPRWLSWLSLMCEGISWKCPLSVDQLYVHIYYCLKTELIKLICFHFNSCIQLCYSNKVSDCYFHKHVLIVKIMAYENLYIYSSASETLWTV